MRCPYCNDENTQVKDSRPSEDGNSIRRRRHCIKCNAKFYTLERIQLRDLFVVKKSGEKKIFDRDKITRAVSTALRKRSIEKEKIEMMVNRLVKKFESYSESEIPTSIIGEEIMKELSVLDQVAYVRFASVYQDFASASDFERFIEKITKVSDE